MSRTGNPIAFARRPSSAAISQSQRRTQGIEEKAQQTYIVSLGLESRLSGALRLTGCYQGIVRVPLGAESTVRDRFHQEFGLNLSWGHNH